MKTVTIALYVTRTSKEFVSLDSPDIGPRVSSRIKETRENFPDWRVVAASLLSVIIPESSKVVEVWVELTLESKKV